MNINKELLHSIQLKDIKMISISAESHTEKEYIDKQTIKLDTKISQFSESKDKNNGKTYLKTILTGKTDDKIIFEIKVIYCGVCYTKNDISQNEFNFFLKLQAVPMLWSYSREILHNTLSKMGFSSIILPVLDINEVVRTLVNSKNNNNVKENKNE